MRNVRTEKNMSQQYVARRAGIGQSAYSRVENGLRPVTAKILIAVAKALRVKPCDLLECNCHD